MPRLSKLPNGLTVKQEAFCVEYLRNGMDATAAYVEAFDTKCSRQHAGRRARTLLKLPTIQRRLAAPTKKILALADVTVERVILQAARLAFGDIRDVASWDDLQVRLKNSTLLEDDAAAAIAEVGMTEHGPKVKLADKKGALELLARILKVVEAENRIDSYVLNLNIGAPPADGAGR